MKKKLKEPYHICFTVPVYNFDVMVIVGAKQRADVVDRLKYEKCKDWIVKHWETHEDVDWVLRQDAGSIKPKDELGLIYVFKRWEDTRDMRKLLVHEVSHMVDDIAEHRNLLKETEARAYLSEYLFDTIWYALS